MIGRRGRGSADFDIVWSAGAEVGEGPMWDARDGKLYWVDIPPGRLHALEPLSGRRETWEVGHMVSAVVPRLRGGFVLAVREGFATWSAEHGFEMLATPAPGEHDSARIRFNDGKCDPAGRFWAGTMEFKGATGAGALYCLFPDGHIEMKERGISISNGLAWVGRRFYYIDSATRLVRAYEYDPEAGRISRPVTALALPPGGDLPDGCTVDVEGMLWIAHWGSGKVTRWDPVRAECLREYRFPVSNIASCTFGGPGLATLYVTSAREDLTPQQLAAEPEAGSVFALKPGTTGVAAAAFSG